jgi:LPPG:FO 2-phospho-L-lactate transferase
LTKKLGIRANILPMTDDRVQTYIQGEEKWLSFQEYFVRKRQQVRIKKISFRGIRRARCGERAAEAIAAADLIIFAPSNPIVSILPILSLAGVKKMLHASNALKVAVSPFVNRRAVSGPAKELMEAKGFEGSSSGVALFYARMIDLLFIHHSDRAESGAIEQQGVKPVPCQTIMKGLRGSVHLAGRILETCWEGLEKRA